VFAAEIKILLDHEGQILFQSDLDPRKFKKEIIEILNRAIEKMGEFNPKQTKVRTRNKAINLN
jgi:hypothetical protein